ncbi:MAG: two-component signal transduction system fused histidine kinase / response regulator [Bacteroidetes bacterium HLUCCA01]|nr:MAG: two-component signal transduction system fused histidine kinase / response regulator [Bacteroidetes bacterium HLUCCA01]
MGSSEKKSILVVDDTQQNVQVLSQMLRDAGYSVMAAFNGKDALKMLERREPDLILMDVMMPEMDGFETTRQLKSVPRWNEIPVIFLSALSDTESKLRAFESGGVDYITKPFQQQEVLARMELHLSLRELQHEKEAYIHQLQEKQEHLQKLNNEKDEVLSVLSHDMRNPLGGIIGIVDLLRSEPVDSPEELETMLELVDVSAKRLLHMVNDMLDIAIIESNSIKLNRVHTDLGALINEVMTIHAPAAKNKNVTFELHHSPDVPPLMLDKSKISQVFGNLISNAIKFTPSQGAITISTELNDDFPGFAFIQVQDTGIGIPETMLPRLFDKMGDHQRPGTDGEVGTGLGMPIVKRYVEVHSGVIDVNSREGEGSTFMILLPLDT